MLLFYILIHHFFYNIYNKYLIHFLYYLYLEDIFLMSRFLNMFENYHNMIYV
jgi:hypothetical protein